MRSNQKALNKHLQNGFAHIIAIIVTIVVLVILGIVGWNAFSRNNQATQPSNNLSDETKPSTTPSQLIWQQAEGGWRSMETPPPCPDQPIMQSPVDLDKATHILYPGQTRGGNYKPHGGFRFNNSANSDITVTAPIDGYFVRGGSYLAEGEIQYTFDIMNNCGIMYRVGHLRVLPASLQKIADTWPAPQEGDSRTHQIHPAVYVKQGEALATSVGIINTHNTFFDWGVYDYRSENEASKTESYRQLHASDTELAWHAVCWFDWLPKSDAEKVKSLPPGDPTSGKMSDYCK